MTRTICLNGTIPGEYMDSLRAKFIDERHFAPDLLIGGEDADVLKPDGSPLLVFRRGVLPWGVCQRAFGPLKRAARPSRNRGDAAGGRYQPVKRDGTRSNTLQSDPVLSGTIGHLDAFRDRHCRTTAYTRDDVRGWFRVLPFIRAVNDVFERELPDRYAAQRAAAAATDPYWLIPGTVFSTVTVNRNFPTAVHKDEGDLREGFGVMAVLSAGRYEGGYLVFPQYRVAADVRCRDVLLADVHEWHGNTPLVGTEGEYDRVSVVCYFRAGMTRCGTAAEEYERARRLG